MHYYDEPFEKPNLLDIVSFKHPEHNTHIEATINGTFRDEDDPFNQNKNFAKVEVHDEAELNIQKVNLNKLTLIAKPDLIDHPFFSEIPGWPYENAFATLEINNELHRGYVSGIEFDFEKRKLYVDLVTNAFIRVEIMNTYKEILNRFNNNTDYSNKPISLNFDNQFLRDDTIESELKQKLVQEIDILDINKIKEIDNNSYNKKTITLRTDILNIDNIDYYN